MKTKQKIYIWGAGELSETVYRAIKKAYCDVEGIVDSRCDLWGKPWKEKYRIEPPDVLQRAVYDYVIISAKRYEAIMEECTRREINLEKVIAYWEDRPLDYFLDEGYKYARELERELEHCRLCIQNAPYEYGYFSTPTIRPGKELLESILRNNASLSRFGDGELEVMRGKERLWYQKVNSSLSEKLREVFDSREKNLYIAVSDNYGNLDKYKKPAADAIRYYMTEDTRREVTELLNPDRVYYDAYVTRPYYMYKTRANADTVFPLFKQIWKGRDVIIAEGKYTRTGVNNDLLKGAGSIKRIICPPENAFDSYGEIVEAVKSIAGKGDLVLTSLGPTSTVLAYDLHREGIQTLDIGQLDNEYEWYIRGTETRIPIPGKTVAEVEGAHEPEDIDSLEYQNQIMRVIG